jgi:hypothetical protein
VSFLSKILSEKNGITYLLIYRLSAWHLGRRINKFKISANFANRFMLHSLIWPIQLSSNFTKCGGGERKIHDPRVLSYDTVLPVANK